MAKRVQLVQNIRKINVETTGGSSKKFRFSKYITDKKFCDPTSIPPSGQDYKKRKKQPKIVKYREVFLGKMAKRVQIVQKFLNQEVVKLLQHIIATSNPSNRTQSVR